MSDDNAQQLMELWDKKDWKNDHRDFIARMEHKLHVKERNERLRRR